MLTNLASLDQNNPNPAAQVHEHKPLRLMEFAVDFRSQNTHLRGISSRYFEVETPFRRSSSSSPLLSNYQVAKHMAKSILTFKSRMFVFVSSNLSGKEDLRLFTKFSREIERCLKYDHLLHEATGKLLERSIVYPKDLSFVTATFRNPGRGRTTKDRVFVDHDAIEGIRQQMMAMPFASFVLRIQSPHTSHESIADILQVPNPLILISNPNQGTRYLLAESIEDFDYFKCKYGDRMKVRTT